MTKVLMVCTANICRSPMALTVGRTHAAKLGLTREFLFDSAGTHAAKPPQPMDGRARQTLLQRGYAPVRSKARTVRPRDFEEFDLVLAMDTANLGALQKICPAEHTAKLRLLMSFAPEDTSIDVPDPYFGNMGGFERVLDLCEAGVRGLLATSPYRQVRGE